MTQVIGSEARLTLRRDGSGQFHRRGGQDAPLAHLLERLVLEAKMHLRGRGITGEHRDEGSRLGKRRGHRRAEGIQEGFRAAERGVCRRDVILHRIQARQVQEDHGLSDGMVPDLIEVVLTSPYPFRCRCRTPERG